MDLDLIQNWLGEAPGIRTVEQHDDRIKVVVDSECELSLAPKDDVPLLNVSQRIYETYPQDDRAALTPIIDQAFEWFVLTLGGLFEGSINETDTGWEFTLAASIYPDGVSQHSVLSVIDQQRKARVALLMLVEDVKARHELSEAITSRLSSVELEEDLPEVEDWVPSIDEVQVATGTMLVGDEREPLGELEPDRWYESLAEVKGWIETVGDGGTFGWIPTGSVVERRTRTVGPFVSSEGSNEDQP